MNKITVIGRVSQDVEVKDFNGRNCANFNVASQNKNKDKNTNQYGTNFYRVTAWGQAADTAARFLRTGQGGSRGQGKCTDGCPRCCSCPGCSGCFRIHACGDGRIAFLIRN